MFEETKENHNDQCSICLEQFDRKEILHDEAQILGCGHKFHPICVMKWIDCSRASQVENKSVVTCPLCRDPTVCFMKICEFHSLLGNALYRPRMLWYDKYGSSSDFSLPLASQLSKEKDFYSDTASTLALIEFGERCGFDLEQTDINTTGHLLQAVWAWHPWPVIEAMLNAGADPDGGERYPGGRKPRTWLESDFYAKSFASWLDNKTNVVETTIRKKRKMSSQSDIVNAIKSGQLNAIQLMIGEWNGAIDCENNCNCRDVLHVAIETGNIDIVRVVVKERRFAPVHVNKIGSYWSGALHVDFATNLGYDKIANFLLTLPTRAF